MLYPNNQSAYYNKFNFNDKHHHKVYIHDIIVLTLVCKNKQIPLTRELPYVIRLYSLSSCTNLYENLELFVIVQFVSSGSKINFIPSHSQMINKKCT